MPGVRKSSLRRMPLVLAVLSMLACQSPGPAPEPMGEPTLPSHFADEVESLAEIPDSFAEAFGDPRLGELIEEALQRNQDLGAAAARVLAAAAGWKGAQAAFQPTLDGSVGAARNKQVFVGLPIPGSSGVLSSYSSQFNAGLSATWEPDLWGRLSAGERVAEAGLGAQAEDWNAARLSIAANVAKGWYTLQAARLQAEWATDSVATWRASLANAQARKDAGVGSSLDLALLESSVATSEAVLARRMETVDMQARSLELLLGRYPGGGLNAPAGSLPALPAVTPGLPADLLARRPDIKAAEWRLTGLRSTWDVAAADMYPRLALTGTLGQSTEELEDLLDGDFTVWSMAANLIGPLWDGGRRRANLQAAEARIQEAEFQFMSLVLVACAEVEIALASDGYLAQQASSLEQARVASSRAKELIQVRWDQGLVSISEVLEADRARIGAESEWLAVQQQRLIKRVELIAALGGGLQAP